MLYTLFRTVSERSNLETDQEKLRQKLCCALARSLRAPAFGFDRLLAASVRSRVLDCGASAALRLESRLPAPLPARLRLVAVGLICHCSGLLICSFRCTTFRFSGLPTGLLVLPKPAPNGGTTLSGEGKSACAVPLVPPACCNERVSVVASAGPAAAASASTSGGSRW